MVTKLRENVGIFAACLRVVLFLMVTKRARSGPMEWFGLRVVLFLMVTKQAL